MTQKILRGLVYIEDAGKKLLQECRGNQRWHLQNLLEEYDFKTTWQFYREFLPHLQKFAADSREGEIKRLVQEYENNIAKIDACINKKSIWIYLKLDLLFREGTEEFEEAIRAVTENTGNLAYQVKLMEQ